MCRCSTCRAPEVTAALSVAKPEAAWTPLEKSAALATSTESLSNLRLPPDPHFLMKIEALLKPA